MEVGVTMPPVISWETLVGDFALNSPWAKSIWVGRRRAGNMLLVDVTRTARDIVGVSLLFGEKSNGKDSSVLRLSIFTLSADFCRPASLPTLLTPT